MFTIYKTSQGYKIVDCYTGVSIRTGLTLDEVRALMRGNRYRLTSEDILNLTEGTGRVTREGWLV